MTKELLKALHTSQEKLKAIDSLSNTMQKLSNKEAKEVAYLIHRIIDSEYYNSDLAREVLSWSLKANKDLFVEI